MKYIKRFFKPFIYMIGIILIFPIVIALLSYIGIINLKFVSILKILVSISSLLVGGYLIGKSSREKGWLEGIKFSIIFLIILSIFNYLAFNHSFSIKNFLYYSILIVSSMFGSMIGINKNKNN